MEKSFSLVMPEGKADLLRATLCTGSSNGRTRIQIEMGIPNDVAAQPLAAVQAEVLRLAIADLEQERQRYLSALPPAC